MPYQRFMNELEKKEKSAVYKSLQTVLDAIKECPAEEQEWMKDWSADLDRLNTMTEDEYDQVREKVFQGLNGMISDYHAPGGLFRGEKVRPAMGMLFDALELNDRVFTVPGFTQAATEEKKYLGDPFEYASARPTLDIPKAQKASAADPLGYAAQYMAYAELSREATPSEMFNALGNVDNWKTFRGLQLTAKDPNAMTALTKGDHHQYLDSFTENRKRVLENSLSFKDYNAKIYNDYKAGHFDYPTMQLKLQALKDLTKDAVEREKDLKKRPRVQDETMVFTPDLEAKVEELEAEEKKRKLAEAKKPKLNAVPGVADTVTTTAQDIYNDLTKKYKAGEMSYVQYENRLKTMRLLTGGNKKLKIDLKTIDDAIDRQFNLQELAKNMDTMENAISKLTGPEADYDGFIGMRLRGIYDVYGLTPKISQKSLAGNGYTQEQFAQLEDFNQAGAEKYLKTDPSAPPISNEDFAVLSIAVTQTYPEIGGVHYFMTDNNGVRNIVKNPTLEDTIKCRGQYTTDVFKDSSGARKGFGDHYLGSTTVPARKKADELLRKYNGGAGSPKELGKVLGLGLRNMLDPLFLAASSDSAFKGDMLLDGAVAGRLADMIEKNPALKKEALKYTTKKDLETAKGLKHVYDIARGSQVAMQKLKDSVVNNKPLPTEERNACIELMLRNRALLISTKLHSAQPSVQEAEKKAIEKWTKMPQETALEQELAGLQTTVDQNRAQGLPDFVRAMGVQGPDFARDLLDRVLPNREAFFGKTDAEIVSAFEKKTGTPDDPFQNKEYKVFRDDLVLGKAMRAAQKSGPEMGVAKTL